MGQKGEKIGGDINLGTDNWNIAEGYTKLKILRQLILLDRFDTIAQFGTEDIGEDLNLTNDDISKRRLEALQRFHSTLSQLIGNVLFALRREGKDTVEGFHLRVKNLNEFIGKCYDKSYDQLKKSETIQINEHQFGHILKILQNIKDDLNTPLNNANLIFRASEEVDLDKIMNDIVEGG